MTDRPTRKEPSMAERSPQEAETDVRLDRILRVLGKWGVDLNDERSTSDQGDDFAEAIREDGAWRFVRDMRSALTLPPGSPNTEEGCGGSPQNEKGVTTVEWRVESETTEDEFGTDERAARRWLAEVHRHVAAGGDHWEPAVLMRRTVTVRTSEWEPVLSPGSPDTEEACRG